jgi:hypothetical protein
MLKAMAKDEELTEVQVVQVPRKTWKRHIWDTLDKPRQERHLLFKLDVALLGLGCLGMFCIPIAYSPLLNEDADTARQGFADWNHLATRDRLLHQVPQPGKYHQCLCFWNVRSNC